MQIPWGLAPSAVPLIPISNASSSAIDILLFCRSATISPGLLHSCLPPPVSTSFQKYGKSRRSRALEVEGRCLRGNNRK